MATPHRSKTEKKTTNRANTKVWDIDWPALLGELNLYLRLRTTPIGMKLFPSVEDMEAVPRIRRPKVIHTADQIVAQACRLGWTVGIAAEDLVGAQCAAGLGLRSQDEEWKSGRNMSGVWFETDADANAHQCAMDVVPYGFGAQWLFHL